MSIWKQLSGSVRIKLTCPDPENILSLIISEGYILRDISFADPFAVYLTVSQREYKSVCAVANKKGAKVHLQSKKGLYWEMISLLHRPVLLAGMVVLIFLSTYLPGRILFVRVEGNQNVPTELILAKASEVGVDFGAESRNIRSEKIKNALLQAIPQLQWVGVNTSGCSATICVEERAVGHGENNDDTICNIIATTDAIIRSCTVVKGTQLCTVGQAVKKGDVLVSAYTDCGLLLKATRADAEIIGQTSRKLRVISPDITPKRGELLRAESEYYLQIGKNIIKFSKDSGISDASCVKMYETRTLALPGGFKLPISIIKEVRQYYRYDTVNGEATDASWIQNFAADHLKSQMIAGSIIQERFDTMRDNGVWIFDGEYVCLESIGSKMSEEILHRNE